MAATRILDVVGHPVRLRILQEVAGRERTTAQLRARLTDVTPATLYRHVAVLIEAEVLTVVAERRVRGATERTLATGPRSAHLGVEDVRAMRPEQLRQLFLTFLGQLGSQMDRFVDEADPAQWAMSGAAQTVLYVDDEDLPQIQQRLAELLADYREPAPGRSRVTLSTVLLPDSGAGDADEST